MAKKPRHRRSPGNLTPYGGNDSAALSAPGLPTMVGVDPELAAVSPALALGQQLLRGQFPYQLLESGEVVDARTGARNPLFSDTRDTRDAPPDVDDDHDDELAAWLEANPVINPRPVYLVPDWVYDKFRSACDRLGECIVIHHDDGLNADLIPLDADLLVLTGFNTAGKAEIDAEWSVKMRKALDRRRYVAALNDDVGSYFMENVQGVCGALSRPVAMLGDRTASILGCTAAPHAEEVLHTAEVEGVTYGWINASDHPMPMQERTQLADMPPLDQLELWDIRPRDLPGLRHRLLQWIAFSDHGRAWTEATVAGDQWMLPRFIRQRSFPEQCDYVRASLAGPLLGTRETEDFRPGGSYYVSADMVALAVEAALDLDKDWTYQTGDVPEPYGFMVLELPMPWHAPRSGINAATEFEYPYYAITWRKLGDQESEGLESIFVQFWTRKVDTLKAMRLDGRDGTDVYEEVEREAPPLTPDNEAVLIHGARWRFHHLDPQLQFLVAVWRLMRQPSLVTVESGPGTIDRAARKQAARVSQRPEVSLVRLRASQRDYAKPLEHRPVEWSHAWRVKSFWRRPPRTPLDHPKTIYVPSHIKGPIEKGFRPRVNIVNK